MKVMGVFSSAGRLAGVGEGYLVMAQAHPWYQLIIHCQDVPQSVDLKFVKGLVDRCFEQGF